jgi:hypothetical protein
MLNPNELPVWLTRLPSGKASPYFRAADEADARAYCKRVGWPTDGLIRGPWHGVRAPWADDLARMTEVTDG